MMLVVLIVIAVVVGFIFKVVVSGIIKFFATIALVLCVALVFSVYSGTIQGKNAPMVMQDDTIYLHIKDQEISIPYENVRQIDVVESQEGYLIKVYVGSRMFEVEVGKMAYKFSLKSDIAKHFGKVLRNYTI